MKRFLLFITVLIFSCGLFAEEASEVPRYKGFAAGGDVLTQFAIGDYSNYAIANLGLSLAGEYTFPIELPASMDLGAALRAEYAHVFPKADTILKSDEELRFFAVMWLRIPFILGGQYFAFQPELGFGISNFFTTFKTPDGNEKRDSYLSPLISITPSVRWIPKAVQQLEIEVAPVFSIVPEKDNATMMLGARLGAIWHFDTRHYNVAVKDEEEPVEEETVIEQEPEKEDLPAPEPVNDEPEEDSSVYEKEPEPEPESEEVVTEQEEETEESKAEPVIETDNNIEENASEPELKSEAEEVITEPEEETEESEETGFETIPEPEEEIQQTEAVETKTEEPVSESLEKAPAVTERLVLKNILFFSKNGAVFSGLTREQINQNEEAIAEAVAIIQAHPECTVVIEGYANNISGTETEDRTACIPLSLWRAEYIKKELIKRGINEEQIETVGKGGANPLASRTDRDNWWKNRRVEFVITYQSEVQNDE